MSPADGAAYVQQQEEVYTAQVRARLEKQLHRRAKEPGYELTKIEPPAAGPAQLELLVELTE